MTAVPAEVSVVLSAGLGHVDSEVAAADLGVSVV